MRLYALTPASRALLDGEQKANIVWLLFLFSPAFPPKLIGIARLAAEGESLRQGHEVEYFTLPARSLLNRCTGERMPFTWTINPYRGCEFACKYCYARYTHEFMEMRDGVGLRAEDLRQAARRQPASAGIAGT